jgi:hypothetical protein
MLVPALLFIQRRQESGRKKERMTAEKHKALAEKIAIQIRDAQSFRNFPNESITQEKLLKAVIPIIAQALADVEREAYELGVIEALQGEDPNLKLEYERGVEQGKASQVALRIEGPSQGEIEDASYNIDDKQCPACGEELNFVLFLKGAKWYQENLRQTECELVLPKERELRAGAASLGIEIGNYNRVQRAVIDAIKKLNTHLKTRVEGE